MNTFGLALLLTFLLWMPHDAAAQRESPKGVSAGTLPGPSPVLVWKFKTDAPIISSPIVNAGTVFFGGLDSSVYAVDLHAGVLKWELQTGGEIRSTPLVWNGIVYVTCGDGLLRAIDENTGSLKWTFATEGERKYDFADYYQSSPVIDRDRVYFGSGDGCLYAVRTLDGTLIWKYRTGDVVHATPALDSSRVYVGSFDGYFYAVDRVSGELAWRFKSVGHYYFPKGEFQGSPSVSGSLVYVGARDFNFYAIDRERGFCHWNKAFPRGWALANVIEDTTLYIGTSDDRLLIAARPSSGREYWKTNLNFNIFGKLAVADSVGYIGTLLGKVYGIDLRSGAIMWTFATDGYEQNHL